MNSSSWADQGLRMDISSAVAVKRYEEGWRESRRGEIVWMWVGDAAEPLEWTAENLADVAHERWYKFTFRCACHLSSSLIFTRKETNQQIEL